ncbi:MAG: hypothetical protein V2B18_08230 [Pseudomonadota bacterium]
MVDEPKRALSAKALLKDLQEGLSDTVLKRKYQLNDKGLQSLYAKLVAKGLVKEAELAGRLKGQSGPADRKLETRPITALRSSDHTAKSAVNPQPKRRLVSWRCPSCGYGHHEVVDECPRCGILVSKLRAREESPGPPAPRGVVWEEPKSSGTGKAVVWGLALILCVVVAVAWLKRPAEQPLPAKLTTAPRPAVQSGQPQDGDTSVQAPLDAEQEAQESSEAEVGTKTAAQDQGRTEPDKKRQSRASGQVKWFTAGNFRTEVAEASADHPVLVMFHADW